MTDEQKNEIYTDVFELLDIYKEYSPHHADGTNNIENVKPAIINMIDYIIKDPMETAALKDWLDNTDFWSAPASTKFHGNFKGGLSLHTLMVIKQSLEFAHPLLENFYASPEASKYTVRAYDIFVAALCHDFCKTGLKTVLDKLVLYNYTLDG